MKGLLLRLPFAIIIFMTSLEFSGGTKAGRAISFDVPTLNGDVRFADFDDGEHHGTVFQKGDGSTLVYVKKRRDNLSFVLPSTLSLICLFAPLWIPNLWRDVSSLFFRNRS